MTIQCKTHLLLHRFLVADIGTNNLILGYPFLEATNPLINWKEGTIEGVVTLTPLQQRKLPTLKEWAKRVTMAQQLAEQATNKKERTWQEQVPKIYHPHGKVFSKQASERFPSE
jgi:hypothetical protein